MRVKVDYSSTRESVYRDFCKKNSQYKISYIEWRKIIYDFNESFRNYILETGEKAKLPSGFGDFSINKRYRKKYFTTPEGEQKINLPVDWQKSKEKGKRIYNFNYHTEGFFFGWRWFKETSARIKYKKLWYFKPSRITSRMLAHYIKTNDKYQHIYKEWDFYKS